MIRTLTLIAVVGFLMAVACVVAALAVAGGPFSIDDHLRFHHETWTVASGAAEAHPRLV